MAVAVLPSSPAGAPVRERGPRSLIPGGATCYSKADDKFPPNAPRMIDQAWGAHFVADGDKERDWLDWGMGLRSVILGHAFQDVAGAAGNAMWYGSNFTRPSVLEGELAERLCDLIPCAEMAAFAKNGSDAVTAAVRLARAATGRTRILACADPFHASDDWWLSTQPKKWGTVEQGTELFPYNEIGPFIGGRLFNRDVAAIVMEPMSFEYPNAGWLQEVLEMCDLFGTVLIFDEVITGFRFDLRGAQHVFGVTPDLACFGKAMANGFSVSALVGKRSIMELADGKHGVHAMSSTHGGETHALAAALATIDVCEREDVSGYIGRIGKRLQDGLRVAGYDVIGHPTSPAIRFPTPADNLAFQSKMCDAGILAPYFAPSFSHTEADVDRTIEAAAR